MFQNKVDYCKGYVKIHLYGLAPERFLALCSLNDILIWDLIYKDNIYVCCVRVSDFYKMKPFLRKTHMHIRIVERKGIPFFVHRNRRRVPFCIGVIGGLCIYVILSMFIWNIHVDGNSKYTTSVIMNYLSEQNIYCGVQKNKINCEDLENALRTQFDDIIWASVRINGANLEVDIEENLYVEGQDGESATGDSTTEDSTKPQGEATQQTTAETDTTDTSGTDTSNTDDTQNQEGTDIVASEDAQIVSMITRTGTPQVLQGDTVTKGTILVLGRLDIYNDDGEVTKYNYVTSDADIYGQVSLPYEAEIPLNYEETTYTGKTRTAYELQVGSYLLSLPHLNMSYDSYDITMEQTSVSKKNYFNIPLAIRKYQAREFVVSDATYTEEEVCKKAEQQIYTFCQNLIEKGVQIVENNVIIDVDKKKCTASGEIIVIEPIGVPKETEIVPITKQEEGTAQDESE